MVQSRYGIPKNPCNNPHYLIRQAPEIRLYRWPISYFAPRTEVSTCRFANGSNKSHTLGDVAGAGIRMILFIYNMYDFRARQMKVPPLLTGWEEDNPLECVIVYP